MKPQDPMQKTGATGPHVNGSANGVHAVPVTPPAPPSPPPALSAPPSLETVFHIVRRRWLTILCLGVLAAGIGFAVVYSLFPGKYTATRNIRINKASRGAYESEDAFSSYVRAQAALIKSPDVLRKVLDQSSVQELREVQSKSDARQWLQDKLLTDTIQSPEILRISLTGDDPEELATILDELVKQYLKEYKTREDIRTVDRGEQLLANYRKTADKLRTERITLATKLQNLGIEDPQIALQKQFALSTAVYSLEAERVKLNREKSADEITLEGLKESLAHPETIVISQSAVDERMKDDPLLKPFYDNLAAVDKKLAETKRVAPTSSLIPQYQTERDGAVRQLQEALKQNGGMVEKKLRDRAVDELRDSIAKLETKLKSYKRQAEIIAAEIKDRNTEIGTLRPSSGSGDQVRQNAASEMDAVAQTEMVLKRIGEELGQIQIDTATGSRVELMDKKLAPTTRKTDTQTKYAGVAAMALFGLVFFGIIFWEYGHRRVYTSTDVTRGLNLPLLGTLPLVSAGARRGIQALEQGPTGDEAILIESIDAIRTQLLHAARTDQIHVVMVTSPGIGEGKTTLACHLAASLARGSRNTLLVDCDLRNPSANRQFNVPNEPGLSEALRGEIEFEEAIVSTPVARLSLLPAGKADRLAIQCLAQENVGKVFHLLREQYEFIIIDVPPVLPVADALLVGQHADAVLFSVLRNVSRLPLLHAAMQKLSSLGVRTLGAVVIGEKAETYGYPRTARV